METAGTARNDTEQSAERRKYTIRFFMFFSFQKKRDA